MEKLLETGKVKAIGVSNFSQKALEQLITRGNVKPAVHQLESHPYLQQQAFLDWHKEQGIEVTAYSPFGNQNTFYDSGTKIQRLIEHPTMVKIAKKHGCGTNHIALAWGIKRGTSVVVKSVNDDRIKSNFECLNVRLDNEDMEEIAKMNGPYRFNLPNWGPTFFEGLEGEDV